MKSLQVFLDIISTSFAMYNWVLSSAQEPFAMLRMRKPETGNPEKRPSGQAGNGKREKNIIRFMLEFVFSDLDQIV